MPLARIIEAAWHLRFWEAQRRISDLRSVLSTRATLRHRDISLSLMTPLAREHESQASCNCKIRPLSLPLISRATMFLGCLVRAVVVLHWLEASRRTGFQSFLLARSI